ncbi:hypothetical protein BDV93DRAFT_508329 [Ceratobasidium sp. AG-I]|nr:hypothetical protein BDV93DRAFT_508329 [Ceratobasidium sp. AG-I]
MGFALTSLFILMLAFASKPTRQSALIDPDRNATLPDAEVTDTSGVVHQVRPLTSITKKCNILVDYGSGSNSIAGLLSPTLSDCGEYGLFTDDSTSALKVSVSYPADATGPSCPAHFSGATFIHLASYHISRIHTVWRSRPSGFRAGIVGFPHATDENSWDGIELMASRSGLMTEWAAFNTVHTQWIPTKRQRKGQQGQQVASRNPDLRVSPVARHR